MRRVRLFAVSLCLTSTAASAQEPGELERQLGFETPQEAGQPPQGWGGRPRQTLFADAESVHGGAWSARLERTQQSEGGFSSLTKSLPLDFDGKTLELRGYLRTEGVTGFAGLWMREDGPGGSLEFDNMQRRGLRDSTPWTEYAITLPIHADARELFFGVLIAGEGTVWADDLRLLVDGRPVWEAPRVVRPPTVFETDREFDDGSRVARGELAPGQIESLAVLGQVWGFLKYHHPRIAAGELHWDYELFRVLPAVLAATDPRSRNAELLVWARKLGSPAACDACAPPAADAHLLPPLDWIRDGSRLGPELAAHLSAVHRGRATDKEHFYISAQRGVGNPIFRNEAVHAAEVPDVGYRLLALFRFWNMVSYWFPYRDVIGEDWDRVLREMVPRFVAADDSDAYRLATLALAARVNDTHANVWNALDVQPPRGDCRLPIAVRFVEDRPVIVDPALDGSETSSDLRRGDVIVALDGRPVESLIAEWSPYYPASNQPSRRRDIAREMTRGPCESVALGVEREGAPHLFRADRVKVDETALRAQFTHDRPGDAFQKLADDVAYLKLSSVELSQVEGYLERARGTRGWVIDIRNYPSAFVVFELGRRFVDEPTPFARFTVPDLGNPGAFSWGEPLTLTPHVERYQGKVTILVDEVSLSNAEYTAMALRAGPRALVVGSTTAGADGNVSSIVLPGGLQTQISGIGVFYPDRRPTQRVGIVPDIVVEPTIAGIRDGRDEVLERALREILGASADEATIRRMAATP
jgi:C-terminal processing protease CtpA/Prc